MSYYMADRKHRKAFLEAHQSLEVKMNLEEQSQQQVRPSGGLGSGTGGEGVGPVCSQSHGSHGSWWSSTKVRCPLPDLSRGPLALGGLLPTAGGFSGQKLTPASPFPCLT